LKETQRTGKKKQLMFQAKPILGKAAAHCGKLSRVEHIAHKDVEALEPLDVPSSTMKQFEFCGVF
jgi:hypothetical protein